MPHIWEFGLHPTYYSEKNVGTRSAAFGRNQKGKKAAAVWLFRGWSWSFATGPKNPLDQ